MKKMGGYEAETNYASSHGFRKGLVVYIAIENAASAQF